MWACVRRYDNNPELAETLAARSDEIKGLVSGVEGFVSYYLIRDGKDSRCAYLAAAHHRGRSADHNIVVKRRNRLDAARVKAVRYSSAVSSSSVDAYVSRTSRSRSPIASTTSW
jgi:hypothetical protein